MHIGIWITTPQSKVLYICQVIFAIVVLIFEKKINLGNCVISDATSRLFYLGILENNPIETRFAMEALIAPDDVRGKFLVVPKVRDSCLQSLVNEDLCIGNTLVH